MAKNKKKIIANTVQANLFEYNFNKHSIIHPIEIEDDVKISISNEEVKSQYEYLKSRLDGIATDLKFISTGNLTEDCSLFFSSHYNDNSLYLEFFLDDKTVNFGVYNKNSTTRFYNGDYDVVIDKLKKEINDINFELVNFILENESTKLDEVVVENKTMVDIIEDNKLNEVEVADKPKDESIEEDIYQPFKGVFINTKNKNDLLKIKNMYLNHSKKRQFILMFNDLKIYDSCTYNVNVSFEDEYVLINKKKYYYNKKLKMKLLN